MKTVSQEMNTTLLHAEEEAAAMFYDYVGLGEEYRASDRAHDVVHVMRAFTDMGYAITREPLHDMCIENRTSFRFILIFRGKTIAHIDMHIDVFMPRVERDD